MRTGGQGRADRLVCLHGQCGGRLGVADDAVHLLPERKWGDAGSAVAILPVAPLHKVVLAQRNTQVVQMMQTSHNRSDQTKERV